MLLPARALLAVKGSDPSAVLAMGAWPFTWRRQPYDWRLPGGTLREFPLATTTGPRFPVYHTLQWFEPRARFEAKLDAIARRGEMLSYVMHGVDALGLAEDHVDPRLRRHPGMERPLAAKLEVLDATLRAITERFEARTFASLLD
jgi:hypothetical protein